MARRRTLLERKTEKLAELDRIKKELAEIEAKVAERLGRIAVSAGLGDLNIDETTLRKELEALAAKFRSKAPTVQTAPAQAADNANRTQVTETSHNEQKTRGRTAQDPTWRLNY